MLTQPSKKKRCVEHANLARITAAMGGIFLAGQLYEYSHLFSLTTNLFASAFYVLTGFHGLHVLIGVSAIIAVLWRSASQATIPTKTLWCRSRRNLLALR